MIQHSDLRGDVYFDRDQSKKLEKYLHQSTRLSISNLVVEYQSLEFEDKALFEKMKKDDFKYIFDAVNCIPKYIPMNQRSTSLTFNLSGGVHAAVLCFVYENQFIFEPEGNRPISSKLSFPKNMNNLRMSLNSTGYLMFHTGFHYPGSNYHNSIENRSYFRDITQRLGLADEKTYESFIPKFKKSIIVNNQVGDDDANDQAEEEEEEDADVDPVLPATQYKFTYSDICGYQQFYVVPLSEYNLNSSSELCVDIDWNSGCCPGKTMMLLFAIEQYETKWKPKEEKWHTKVLV
jgi:hypothetical protein